MKILIVDDEAGLAAGLARSLAEIGWDPPGAATSSEEAVEWINQQGGLDVLICNAFLPSTDGFTLRETLLAHLPELRTIFLSAYDVSEHAERMQDCALLPKPVSAEALDAALRQLFAPAAESAPVAAPVKVHAVRAVAAPKPVAVAKAVVAPKAATAPVAAAVAAERELPPDEFVGRQLGDYLVEAKIGESLHGGIYRAVQARMSRKVRLYLLDAAQAADPATVQRFVNDASVKANVSHPSVFAVYEAGQSDGICFYSCEYVPCRSLREIKLEGDSLDENTALQAMKVACQVLEYFSRNQIPHEMITPGTILIGPGGRPRIANIAAEHPDQDFDENAERGALGRIIMNALPEYLRTEKLGVRKLALGLETGEQTFPSWTALSEAVSALEPKVAPKDAYKLDARERAAIRMVDEARKRQRKSMIVSSAISLALLAAALGVIYWAFFRPKGATVRIKENLIEIPAGEFLYQDGQKVTLPRFFIDEYEVTIAQYAEFLDYLAAHPGEAAKFDHPDQPKGKPHVPLKWADEELATGPMPGYYTRAKKWGKYEGFPLDVNSPVFNLDWFDAYAYAKWKGRRLPTEQEWEKAARGTQGFRYPWGNDADPSKLNSGVDIHPNPAKGGEKDGFKRWAPVDAKKADKSPFGVMDMGGNVSEWTATYATDPMMAGQKVPVIRGGNWRNPDYAVTRRVLLLTDLQSDNALGFRTVSDSPPGKEKK